MEKKKVSSPNDANLIGCLYAQECKLIHITTLHKTQVQVDQRPQHKTGYTNLIKEKVGNNLKLIGIGDNFLNRTPMLRF